MTVAINKNIITSSPALHSTLTSKRSAIQKRIDAILTTAVSSLRRFTEACGLWKYNVRKTDQPSSPYAEILARTPAFNGYKIGKGTPYSNTPLLALSCRPANLFYRALLGKNDVTQPSSMGVPLFAFKQTPEKIRKKIFKTPPDHIVSFSANGVHGSISLPQTPAIQVPNLSSLYGNAEYQISYGELQAMLTSQKVFVSPLFPLPFYRALKKALLKDKIILLPGNKAGSIQLKHLRTSRCAALIKDVNKNWKKYGFANQKQALSLLDMTPYQLGALVVKSENFRIFIDETGKILARKPGTPDEIRLINLCGIRDGLATDLKGGINKKIMTHAFAAGLAAAEKGLMIVPAVGMGVWHGDPNLYWRAFFDAVVETQSQIEQIFINPRHQATLHGPYQGCMGEEFKTILQEYKRLYAHDPKALMNLNKIIDLYEEKTDVIHLARLLKQEHPDRIISLVNASDPDVTLGNHVGEYVNALGGSTTTEENYTAIGTNGLCFETITGVLDDPGRVVATPSVEQ